MDPSIMDDDGFVFVFSLFSAAQVPGLVVVGLARGMGMGVSVVQARANCCIRRKRAGHLA